MDDFLTKAAFLALGALITFLLQLVAGRAQKRADLLCTRLDELCETVSDLSVAAALYWATPPESPELLAREAELFRLNHRAITTEGLVREERADYHTQVGDALLDLSDAATGGTFQVANRPADIRRYVQIERHAMRVVRETRRFQRELLRGWFW